MTYDETVVLMDQLKFASEEYGLSVTEAQGSLQKLGPSMTALGLDSEYAIGVLSAFAESGVDASVATTAMQKALMNVESPAEFERLINDISSTEDSFARAQKAIELFGPKAGPQLANTLKPGADSIQDFIGSLDGATGAVDRASDAFDSSLKVQLNLLKKQLQGLFTDLGENLAPLIKAFVGWLQDNMPAITATLTFLFETVGAAIGLIVDIIGALIGAFTSFGETTDETTGEVEGVIGGLLEAFKETFALIIDVIRAAWEIISIIWEEYGEFIMTYVVLVFENILNSITMVLNVIKGVIDFLLAVIKGDWEGAWEAIKEIVYAVGEWIINYFKTAFKLIENVFKGYTKLLTDVFQGIGNFLLNTWSKITDWLTAPFTKAWDKIKEIMDKIKGFFGDKFGGGGDFNVTSSYADAISGGGMTPAFAGSGSYGGTSNNYNVKIDSKNVREFNDIVNMSQNQQRYDRMGKEDM